MATKKTTTDKTTTEGSPEKGIADKKAKGEKAKPKVDLNKTDQIKMLTEQLTSEKDRVLRLSAEFENYKKRNQRESDEFRKFANETVFKQFLTVVDNLERAIDSTEENKKNLDGNGLLEGVKLTHKEIIKLFDAFNVKPVEADNQPFDPNFHQAVTQEETDELPENTVSKVLQKGYVLHDRLLRPAMVVVSKKTEKLTEKNKKN